MTVEDFDELIDYLHKKISIKLDTGEYNIQYHYCVDEKFLTIYENAPSYKFYATLVFPLWSLPTFQTLAAEILTETQLYKDALNTAFILGDDRCEKPSGNWMKLRPWRNSPAC